MSGFVGGRAGAREAPWALDARVLARVLGTDAERGLPAGRAAVRLRRARRRRTPEGFALPAGATGRLFGSFRAALVAAAVSAALLIEELVIAAAFTGFLVLRTLFDAVLGRTARQAFHDVARLGTAEVWVVRSGRGARTPVTDVVVGDLVELAGGQVVPVDVRLVAADGLVVDPCGAPEPLTVAKPAARRRARPTWCPGGRAFWPGVAVAWPCPTASGRIRCACDWRAAHDRDGASHRPP